MSSTIRKVALAGATGNLGPAILDQLLKAGFEVTVLTRQGSTHKFPDNVIVKAVDYDSLDSLSDALRGQDAAVSTLASLALSKQQLLVQAAVNARVQRFIPSEFGSNTSHPKASQLPVFREKLVIQDALKKEADAGRLTYTLINNGPFLDWGLRVGWIADAKNRAITLYDGGDRVFSTTTVSTIGQAVASVLKHPEETKNRVVYVQSIATTLKKLKEIGQNATGATWEANVIPIDDQLNEAWTELRKEQPNPDNFVMKFINTSIWGDGYGGHFEKNDNELLGIKELNETEIQSLIQATAQ